VSPNRPRAPAAASVLLASACPHPVPAETEGPGLVSISHLLDPFSEEEIRRLYWVRGTFAAEQHLVPWRQPCPDHQACRRLAFALWLRCTERISETERTEKP
jgi:hypothetical protein